jgi:hypothetical protein
MKKKLKEKHLAALSLVKNYIKASRQRALTESVHRGT